MRFDILGPLRVRVDGRSVALRSPKQRSMLGALLIDVGSEVSIDRLAEIMWRDDQPEYPPAALQIHVSRLRTLLHRWGGEQARQMLVTRPTGYALAIERERVDAGRFERLVEQARAASTPRTTADLLEGALELWRGPALEGFDHEFARTEASRLDRLRISALELRADALLASGQYGLLVDELETVVARHPLRERLRGQLMVALDRCGRRADALATYRELRDLLVRELGMEPSEGLRRLELAILQQIDDLPWPAPGLEIEATTARSRRSRVSAEPVMPELPEALTSFVGREEDQDGVVAALARSRIVVLTGVGGVGKSRLAVRVARRLADAYADGVVLCDLAGAEDPEAVPEVVATALAVLPTERDSPLDAVVESLHTRQLLLVLDNCEHVRDPASEIVQEIASACAGVDVLATSRQPLAVAGQQIWPVLPLRVGDDAEGSAIALFRDRAQAVDPSFQPGDADRDAVVEICRRLDGLPLAVELAAARVRAMTPADIARRLDQRFHLLVSDPGAAPARHRSLQAVVDWSYALLPDGAQRLFDRLAVFAGGFDLSAAEQVCAGDGLPVSEVAGRLAELVDHSLVTVDHSGRHARYRLLDVLRAQGEGHLEAAGELPAWRRRHAEHFTSVGEGAVAGLRGPDEAAWVHLIDTEFANLRAAQSWARASGQLDVALHLPANLCDYAYYRLRDEVSRWALRALELPAAAGAPGSAAAHVTAAIGCMQRGELERADDHAESALEATSDDEVALRALQLLAEGALYRGCLEETDRLGWEIVARSRAAGSAYFEALGQLYRVHAACYAGRGEDAVARLEEGWQVVSDADNPSLRAGYCYLEGEVRLDTDPEAAIATLRQAIVLAQPARNRFVEGIARVAAASLEARHGQPDQALAAFREIIGHWHTAGDWTHMWTTLHNLLALLERVGAHEPAAVLLGAVGSATTGARAFGASAERLEATAVALRTALGEDVFADAHIRGRAMRDDDAVEHALALIERLLDQRAPT